MHDCLLSMTLDYINEDVKKEVELFTVKTHNRNDTANKPLPILETVEDESVSTALTLTQHEFSLNKVDIQACRGKHHPERAPSANEFTAHFPLAREIFETIFINSLGASTSQRVLRYPYPSGGALYSGQAIVFINNVEGYKKGSYHYLPISNQFEKLDSLCESIVNDALFIRNDHNLKNYDFFILYGSLIDKHLCKYGYRGYRLAILEIGSMYRNTELELQRLNLGSTIWGGFQDEALSVALGIDPRVVIPVICQIVGR